MAVGAHVDSPLGGGPWGWFFGGWPPDCDGCPGQGIAMCGVDADERKHVRKSLLQSPLSLAP